MKKPQQPKHQKFDPDALDFYLWDHMNVVERFRQLEFRLHPKLALNGGKVYTRDVPLARGYKHERSKRPASFCRIQAVYVPNDAIHLNFTFGWFRRMLRRKGGIKHMLIVTPDGEYDQRRSINEHQDLVEFEQELQDFIRVLHTHEFESIQELYDFTGHWSGGYHYVLPSVRRDATRIERAFAAIQKTEETRQVVRKASEWMSHPRMGRPIMRQGMISYRGR